MKTEILGRPAFHLVLIAILGLLIYSNTFDVPFQLDDQEYMVDNPAMRDFRYFIDLSQIEGYKILGVERYLKTRYVAYLSFWANYSFGGVNVTGYHVVNIVVHVINGLLVYLMVALTFKTPFMIGSPTSIRSALNEDGMNGKAPGKDILTLPLSGIGEGGSRSSYIALFSALLFVAHPVQTMAVTYILQRCASLATMFYLLSTVLYLKWRLARTDPSTVAIDSYRKSGVRRGLSSVLLYVLSLCSCILAMKTKEIAFTFPIMIALYEFLFFTRLGRNATREIKGRVLYLAPFFITMLIVPCSYINQNVSKGDVSRVLIGAMRLENAAARLDYFLSQFGVITTYIRLLFLPVGQSMYYEDMVRHSFSEPGVFLPVLFLLGVFGFGVYCLVQRRHQSSVPRRLLRLSAFGIFWFFLALSVESSILPISDVMNEYRVYLPSVGAFMAVVSGAFYVADRFGSKGRTAAAVAAVAMVLVFSSATYARNTVWQSTIRLWEDTVKKAPGNASGYFWLGKAYEAEGLLEKAVNAYKKCIELRPDYFEAYNNLGIVYMATGMTDLALEQYRKGLEFNPYSPTLHANLGTAYQTSGMVEEAIEQYKAALKLDPSFSEAHNNLGGAYMAKGMVKEATEQYKAALKFDPGLVQAYINLGQAYLGAGDLENAEDQYQRALDLLPDNATLYSDIGSDYLDAGYTDRAIKHFEAALELNPEHARTHSNLGAVYQSKGMVDNAIEHYRTAAELEPRDPTSYYNLGIIYQSRNLIDNAIQLYQIALKVAPKHAGAHNNLGVAYRSKGMVDRAIEHYRAALELAPDYAQAHYNLGLVYLDQGLKAEARGEFEEALRIDPDYVNARESLDRLNRKPQV